MPETKAIRETKPLSTRQRRQPNSEQGFHLDGPTGLRYFHLKYKDKTFKVQIDVQHLFKVTNRNWRVQPSQRYYADPEKNSQIAYIYTTFPMPGGKTGRLQLHSLVYWLGHGDIPPDCVIDHRDRNPLNNRLANLRALPTQLNTMNSDRVTKGTSKFPGVGWHESNKWRAITTVKNRNGSKQTYLGVFIEEKEAAKAVLVALIKNHPTLDWESLTPEFFPGLQVLN